MLSDQPISDQREQGIISNQFIANQGEQCMDAEPIVEAETLIMNTIDQPIVDQSKLDNKVAVTLGARPLADTDATEQVNCRLEVSESP